MSEKENLEAPMLHKLIIYTVKVIETGEDAWLLRFQLTNDEQVDVMVRTEDLINIIQTLSANVNVPANRDNDSSGMYR